MPDLSPVLTATIASATTTIVQTALTSPRAASAGTAEDQVEEQLERRDLVFAVPLALPLDVADQAPSTVLAGSFRSSVAVQLARRFSASSDLEPGSAV